VLDAGGVAPPDVRLDPSGAVVPVATERCLAPVPDLAGYWFEVVDSRGDPRDVVEQLAPLLGQLLDRERDSLNLAKQLASRYEETQLLYSISEILGRTISLDLAADWILREVSDVVGSKRASIFVYDEAAAVLRPVAALGKDLADLGPVELDDPKSITARVFRDGRIVGHDPRHPVGTYPGTGEPERGYRGTAFVSVPIMYPDPQGAPRPVGVMNLTDRLGTDAFSGGERRLVAAVASQIGAAIENARLVQRDLARQRLDHELELAHDLQLKLLPSPELLGPDVDVAARCEPAERVGGDFYHFLRLAEKKVGVMLGDVSSHGYAAALIMALVRSAAGIHAAEAASPDGALRRLLDSIAGELAETEMYLTLFYGVIDPDRGRLRYSNAGHPHAFRVGANGETDRLGATSPPLGLAARDAIAAAETDWSPGLDRLLLFSDGISDAVNAAGERFGEERVLEIVAREHRASSEEIVGHVLHAVDAFEPTGGDDRTVLVLRT
jgi:sigma-B regulation protein RsbU (phosphoserine phosphatase)